MPSLETARTDQVQAPTTGHIVNDFSIQVATVNGSGSQTANLVLIRSIFHMGVPVSGKNLFPSNIAGLPTWYTIRANAHGYIARKKEIDVLVAMNPETAQDDVRGLAPGAAVVYDEPLNLRFRARRPRVLPGPVRQAAGGHRHGRQAAAPGEEHGLRRRAVPPVRHRAGRDEARLAEATGEEAEGAGDEPGGARGGLRVRRRATSRSGMPSASTRMDATAGKILDRGQRRGGAGLHDGRRHRRRLVSRSRHRLRCARR